MGLSLGDVDSERVASLTAREEADVPVTTYAFARAVEGGNRSTSRAGCPAPSRTRPRNRSSSTTARGAGSGTSTAMSTSISTTDSGSWSSAMPIPRSSRPSNRRSTAGSHFAQPVAENIVVARELARRFHQPQWRFTNSGTESTLDAIRLARGFTDRERIIKIEASYHGHHDALLVSVEPTGGCDGRRRLPEFGAA